MNIQTKSNKVQTGEAMNNNIGFMGRLNAKLNIFKSSRLKNQKGISLLEVLLSLSIIAIILVMATRYYFLASNAQRVNQTKSQIAALVAAVALWKNDNYDYSKLASVETLVDAGDFHANSSYNGGVLYNPWGEKIDVVGVASGAAGGSTAMITTNMQSPQQCLDLKSSFPTGKCSAKAFSMDVYGNGIVT